MNEAIRETINMANNLATMIAKSGMLKREVAKAKGVVPETISRHCSGVLQFTLKDAEEYARILDCTPQEVLFAQTPTSVFGYMDEGVITPLTAENPESYYCPWVSIVNKMVIGNHTHPDKQFLNGAFYLFNDESIKKKEINTACFMKLSICKFKNQNKIVVRVLYPEPGGKYTLSPMNQNKPGNKNPERDIINGVELAWATPILSAVYQPELFGVVKAI
jgi:hypothetical protein